MGRRSRDGSGGRHPLLLLRSAVRDQTQSEERRGGRVRAPIRLPLQRGQALSKGGEALPPGKPPRPPAPTNGARPGLPYRVPGRHLGRGAGSDGKRDPAHPGRARRRLVRRALRGLDFQREVVSDGQVRPARDRHRQPRLQRPALHGLGGRGRQEGARHRSGRQPVVGYPPRRGGVRRGGQHRRVRPDHHQLHLEGPRPRGQADRDGPKGHSSGTHRRCVPRGPARDRSGRPVGDPPRPDRARLARPPVHR